MMRSSLAVLFAVICSACVSTPSTQHLHYVVVRGETITVRDNAVDQAKLHSLRTTLGNDFAWFERDGAEYVTTDAEVIARADEVTANARQIANRLGGQSYENYIPAPHADQFENGSMFAPSKPIDPTDNQYYKRQSESVASDRSMNRLLDDALGSGAARRLR